MPPSSMSSGMATGSVTSLGSCFTPLISCFSPAHCFGPSQCMPNGPNQCLPVMGPPPRTKDPTRLPGPPPIIPEDDVLPDEELGLLGPSSQSMTMGYQGQPADTALDDARDYSFSSTYSTPQPYPSPLSMPLFHTPYNYGGRDSDHSAHALHHAPSNSTLADSPTAPLLHLPFPPEHLAEVQRSSGATVSDTGHAHSATVPRRSRSGSFYRVAGGSAPQHSPWGYAHLQHNTGRRPSVNRHFHFVTPTPSSNNLMRLSTGSSLATARETFEPLPLDGSDIVVDVSHHGDFVSAPQQPEVLPQHPVDPQKQQQQQEQEQMKEDQALLSQQDPDLVEDLVKATRMPSHAEPRTGVFFSGTYQGLNLSGVGVRAKKLMGMSEINVYAVGVYLDVQAAKAGLSSKFGVDMALHGDAVCDEINKAECVDKTVKIILTLSVTQAQFLGALEERLAPPLKAAGAMDLLNAFRKQFKDVSFSRGTDVTLSCENNGQLTTKVNDEVKGVLNSPLLCHALFSIWLGHDSVTPGATASFVATMEKLTQQA
ncbi:chalcone-flavanone isomerase-domain-containing protein [Dunaliella salina]|uniref:Chalcone-flavanone isomerase-domain-containing protein n=1 Tax=Dunaliella salina TaxID=3046 RepID=A0ABQ7GQH4_DUNSA|nr:chalcone-flavanone isomerase-domain-containing protein [Dunaliella salina]|eukprot:KAF5836855.1 chalcone-flavanone isomerase-domain-containing protein [Dunaliella salina]